jgi:hypothetical protein
MTNVMHKFLINLSIYFCLTCFGLSFSPSSEAGEQLRQWFKSPGYGVSARARMELCYTSATTGRGDHEVHKGHVVALGKKFSTTLFETFLTLRRILRDNTIIVHSSACKLLVILVRS